MFVPVALKDAGISSALKLHGEYIGRTHQRLHKDIDLLVTILYDYNTSSPILWPSLQLYVHDLHPFALYTAL